jgi:hypothetical protein
MRYLVAVLFSAQVLPGICYPATLVLVTQLDDKGRQRPITKTDLREILSTPAYATKAAKFLKATGLLGQFRGCDTTEQVEQ